MMYLLIKATHVSAALVFIGGLLLLTFAANTTSLVLIRAVRRWDLHVTMPALASVWVSGLAVAILGHWFGHTWLTIKLVLVVFLSALHGILSGRLRRAKTSSVNAAPLLVRFAGPVIVLTVCVIAFLAVTKQG